MKIIKDHVIFFCLMGLISSMLGCASRTPRETFVVKVVRDYAPIVVNIRTETIVNLKDSPEWGLYGEQLDNFFREHFGEDYSEGTLKYKSVGSGVIIDNRGLIVTNAHVVQMAKTIYVVLKDGTILDADVLGINQFDDLAIIKTVLPYPVKQAKFANVNDLMIGETVIAIGNPLGLENSVSAGIVSGRDREFQSQQCGYVCSGLLQTDAPINPGNSGGALLNLDGELLGLNLAVAQRAQNIGFAVPVDKIIRMLEDYK